MKKEEQSFGCGISVSQKGHALSGWILRIVPLFAMLFATVAAKAAGDGDGVKFNPVVRYSQWAINSRAHDFMPIPQPSVWRSIKPTEPV